MGACICECDCLCYHPLLIVETHACTAADTERSEDTQARVQDSSTSAATLEDGKVSQHLDTSFKNLASKLSTNQLDYTTSRPHCKHMAGKNIACS